MNFKFNDIEHFKKEGKIGIIGTGNMGSAIANALLYKDFNLILSDKNENKNNEFKNFSNAKLTNDNNYLVKESNIIFIAVKPNVVEKVLKEIKKDLNDEKILISIVAGLTIQKLNDILGNIKSVMVMPNTPALVNESMNGFCPNELLNNSEIDIVKELLNTFGKSVQLPEKEFPIFAGLCGCLPAYVYMFIEALSDSAVLKGLKREDSYEFIAQTILGSAKMILETKENPGKLKDNVTSPGGTTIEGVKVLEEKGFRGVIIDGILASIDKSIKMSE